MEPMIVLFFRNVFWRLSGQPVQEGTLFRRTADMVRRRSV